MWTTIITSILPILIKLIGMFFSSKDASADQRQAYEEFILKIQKSPNTSARLKLSYEEQLKALQEQSK